MPREKLPGTPLKEAELQSLVGLVEYVPRARYEFSTGQAHSRFLEGLREGKVLGRVCRKCGRVYVPPRMYCEYCFRHTDEWVEVKDEGWVETAVASHIGTFRERLEKPEIIAVVRLDTPGYARDSYEYAGLFHRICNASEDDVKTGRIIGRRVRARWKPKEERTGSITDIDCFEIVE